MSDVKGWPAEASIYEWPAEASVYDNLARPSLSHKSMQQGDYVESLTCFTVRTQKKLNN